MTSSSEPTSLPLDGAGEPTIMPSKPSSYSGVGGGLAVEEDNGGPILPDMPLEEEELGFALREWRRLNAIRLEEKERKEKELLEVIIEEAELYKAEFYRKRQVAVEGKKSSNRETEKLLLANREKFHAEAENNYWSAVSDLIPKEVPTVEKRGKKKEQDQKKPSIVVIQGPKPGKPTNLSRMRHILLKLKHNTPPHMKFKPPTPGEPKSEEGEGGTPEQPSAASSTAATPELAPAARG